MEGKEQKQKNRKRNVLNLKERKRKRSQNLRANEKFNERKETVNL